MHWLPPPSPAHGCALCILRKPGCPWLRRKAERKRALRCSPEHILTLQSFFRSLPQPWFLPSNQPANCNCTSLYNNEFPSPSSLPGISFGDVDNWAGDAVPGKDAEEWGQGSGGSKNRCPRYSIANSSLRCYLAIYKLTAPGPGLRGDHCLARPGRGLSSARSAAPWPPRAGLALPEAHPLSPLCMRQRGRLEGCRRGTKVPESEPTALQGPSPQPSGEEAREGHQKPASGQQKRTPGPPPSSAQPRVPISPSHFHTIPVQPALLSILRLSLRLRAETRSFF